MPFVSPSWWGSGGGQALARQAVTRAQRGAAWRASAWACLSLNNLQNPQNPVYHEGAANLAGAMPA